MPLSVSFAHIKRHTRLLLLLLLLKFCTLKCLFSLYMHIAQLQQHWKYLFSTQKRPLSTPKHTTAKCNFFFLSNTSFYLYFFFHSLNFAHSNGIRQAQGKHIQTCAHTQTRTQKCFSLSMCLSRYEKLSLDGGRKRQQRERKYKCSANGFCGDVTVASVGDRWKR